MPKENIFGFKTSYSPNKHYNFGKKIEPRVLVTLRGLTMGGQYMVRAVVKANEDFENLNSQIKQTLDIVENQMSVFKPHSNLMQFNAFPINQWFDLPAETADVLDIAFKIGELSDGALDITLAPLIELWGFGATETNNIVPSEDKLAPLRDRLGYQVLEFDKPGRRILKKSHCNISLNSVAKGYAADLVAKFLKSQSIDDFMVEVAGEIVTAGVKPDGSKWRLAIEKPISGRSVSQIVISISDMAIATSGDYRKYFEHEGVRISHVLDPKTLKPITHKLASVTVVEKKSAMADALATAMLVMGENKALEFAKTHNIAAYFIIKSGTEFKTIATDDMTSYLHSPS